MEELGKIIVFRVLVNTSKSTMNKFCRQFYGYLDRSYNSQYKYQREGFIERFPYIKPLRGVIVVKKEDAKEIISFLNSYDAEIYARDIILIKEDKDKLKSIDK